MHERYLSIINHKHSTPFALLCQAVLWPPGKLYEAATQLRNLAYDKKLLKEKSAGVPVISVGNITAGGTGKTPLVARLAKDLNSRGRRPAILSRGYGTGPNAAANDENTMLRLQLPGIPVLENPNRYKSAVKAVKDHGADVLLLDDGFQHRRLARDLDIVIIDVTNPFGGGKVLPAGLLREPIGGLRRADAVVLTRTDLIDSCGLEAIREKISDLAPGIPAFNSKHKPLALHPIRTATPLDHKADINDLKHGKWAALCAIGNPEAFRSTLRRCGADIKLFKAFRDHHHYKENEVMRFFSEALQLGCRGVIITEKDAVKIENLNTRCVSLPVYHLEINMEIQSYAGMTRLIQNTIGN